MEIIMIKNWHKEFNNKFNFDVKDKTLECIIKGDTEILLWNTNIKVYPIGQKYYIEHSYYEYSTYNVNVYGLAYIGGQIKEVWGQVRENRGNAEEKIPPLSIISMDIGESFKEIPDYWEAHKRAQKCFGSLIFNDDGGTTKVAYQKAIEKLKKDMSEKSPELIELEKQLEFKASFYGGPSKEAVERSFVKNMEVMKEINKLID